MYMSKLSIFKAIFGTVIFVAITGFILGINMTIAHSPGGLNGGMLVASIATVIAVLAVLFWALPMHFFLHYYDIKLMLSLIHI